MSLFENVAALKRSDEGSPTMLLSRILVDQHKGATECYLFRDWQLPAFAKCLAYPRLGIRYVEHPESLLQHTSSDHSERVDVEKRSENPSHD